MADKKSGRPSSYTDEMGDAICGELAEGKSLASICTADDMPNIRTVYSWLRQHDRFLQAYTRAREDQGDTDADKIGEIQAGVLAGRYDPQAARVAIDALKWTAARRQPKKYGEKSTTVLEDPDGKPVTFIVRDMTKEDGK